MDGHKFDEITRKLSTGTSRRRVLKGLGAGGAATVVGLFLGRKGDASAAGAGEPCGTPAAAESVPPAGFLGAAMLAFGPSDLRTGIIRMEFRVAAFDTADHAEAALRQIGSTLPQSPVFADLQATPVPTLADDTLAFTGHFTAKNGTIKTAVLLIRDGEFAHVWVAAGFFDDPMPELLTVAQRWFAPTHPRIYDRFVLRDLFPQLEDLPADPSWKAQGGRTFEYDRSERQAVWRGFSTMDYYRDC